MQKKCFRFVALLLTSCLLLIGCRADPPNPLAFSASDFSVELDGKMGEIAFCVAITVENCDGGRLCRLVYSAPKSLDGLEIELLCTEDGTGIDTATVKTGNGAIYTVGAAAVKGLCLPLYSLLCAEEIASVQKSGSDYLFVDESGSKRLVSAKGYPLSFSSTSICWTVRWFQVA